MKVIHRIATDRFTVSDYVRAAAEMFLKVEIATGGASHPQTPLLSGRMVSCEVQPGLTASVYDITYLSDQEICVSAEPALLCAVQVRGDEDSMEVCGHGDVVRPLERPVLVGCDSAVTYRRQIRAHQRCCGAGFVMKPHFFDRFSEHVANDGLAALKEFFCSPFRSETLARSPQLVELAHRSLDHPYEGNLGELFLECNTLSFVIEVAKALDHERQMVARIGRSHYERVMEAREILDSNLVAPPRTLDLARQVGTNVTTLQAHFNLVLGSTIFGYLRDQRLLAARVLLREHGITVAEAGYRVGFSSPAAFTAAYRRRFGHPPRKEALRYRA